MPTSGNGWQRSSAITPTLPYWPDKRPSRSQLIEITQRAQMTAQSEDTLEVVGDGDVTVGELSRRLDRLEAADQRSFRALDDRMASSLVTRDYYDGRQQAMGERIRRLEDREDERSDRSFQIWVAVIASVLVSLGSLVTVLVHVHG